MKAHRVLLVATWLFCGSVSNLIAQGPTPRSERALDRLRSNIEQITKSVDTNWGIYIKCIDTGEEIARNITFQQVSQPTWSVPILRMPSHVLQSTLPTILVTNEQHQHQSAAQTACSRPAKLAGG